MLPVSISTGRSELLGINCEEDWVGNIALKYDCKGVIGRLHTWGSLCLVSQLLYPSGNLLWIKLINGSTLANTVFSPKEVV